MARRRDAAAETALAGAATVVVAVGAGAAAGVEARFVHWPAGFCQLRIGSLAGLMIASLRNQHRTLRSIRMRYIGKAIRLAVMVVVALALMPQAGSRARAQEPLRWKFEQGQKLDYNMVQDMKMAGEGGPLGQMNMSMRQEMDMTWDVQNVNDKGEAVIKQKFDRIRTKMTMPIGGFEYDSQSTDPPQGTAAMLAPMYKAMTGSEFEVTMTDRGEIKDVKVPDEMLAAIKNSPGAAMMGEMATSEGFKKMIKQGALELPVGPPEQGQEWKTDLTIENPVAGKQVVETTYRYEGTKDVDGKTYALIRPQVKMDFGAPGQNAEGQPAQAQQLNMKIADQSSEGEILFDPQAGRLHSSEMKQKFTLDMSAGGQAMKQKIDQTITVNVKPAGEGEESSETVSTQSQQ
jgi:hypothetical protein